MIILTASLRWGIALMTPIGKAHTKVPITAFTASDHAGPQTLSK